MQLFQQAPAETTAYMVAGFAVIFVMMFAYVASLFMRNRNQKFEYELLESMEETNTNI